MVIVRPCSSEETVFASRPAPAASLERRDVAFCRERSQMLVDAPNVLRGIGGDEPMPGPGGVALCCAAASVGSELSLPPHEASAAARMKMREVRMGIRFA